MIPTKTKPYEDIALMCYYEEKLRLCDNIPPWIKERRPMLTKEQENIINHLAILYLQVNTSTAVIKRVIRQSRMNLK